MKRKKKEKKHTIERKMQISKVDETYCVLRYNIWQIEHTSKDNSSTRGVCALHAWIVLRLGIVYMLGFGILHTLVSTI
jgi:hypothetical protein